MRIISPPPKGPQEQQVLDHPSLLPVHPLSPELTTLKVWGALAEMKPPPRC